MAIATGCFVNDMEADENISLGRFFQSVKYSRCIPEDDPRNTYGPYINHYWRVLTTLR